MRKSPPSASRDAMLAVVDTNVWVSAFLTPGGSVAAILDAFRAGRLTPAYSDAIEAEYREVLGRPRFRIDPELAAEFLLRLHADGVKANPPPAVSPDLPDPADVPFIALARAFGCPVVTGNVRHFPPEAGVEVLTPAQCLERIAA